MNRVRLSFINMQYAVIVKSSGIWTSSVPEKQPRLRKQMHLQPGKQFKKQIQSLRGNRFRKQMYLLRGNLFRK